MSDLANLVVDFIRAERMKKLNAVQGSREQLEQEHGQIWSTDELCDDFRVVGFAAPFVVVERRSDGVKGSLEFQHMPRFYFNWVEDK
jgi:hypothetical protein